jgi:hypothetical protein
VEAGVPAEAEARAEEPTAAAGVPAVEAVEAVEVEVEADGKEMDRLA